MEDNITIKKLNKLGFTEYKEKEISFFKYSPRWFRSKLYKLNNTIEIFNNSDTMAYYIETIDYKRGIDVSRIFRGNDVLFSTVYSTDISSFKELKHLLKLLKIDKDIYKYTKHEVSENAEEYTFELEDIENEPLLIERDIIQKENNRNKWKQ